jgi:hypothetical protein
MPPSNRFETHPFDLTRPRAHFRDPFLRRHPTKTLQLHLECFLGRVSGVSRRVHNEIIGDNIETEASTA